jgi:hypothetical protein
VTALEHASEKEKREGLPDVHTLTASERIDFQTDLLLKDEDFRKIGERVMTLLANGISPPKIQTLTGIPAEVSRRIRDRNPKFLRNVRDALVTNLAEASLVLSEQLIENAQYIPAEYLGKNLAQVVDRFQLLSGGVTARTEVRNISSPEELQKMFEALPLADATVVTEDQDGSAKPNLS